MTVTLCTEGVFYSWLIDIYTFVGVPVLVFLYVGNNSIGQSFLRFSVVPGIYRLATYVAQ